MQNAECRVLNVEGIPCQLPFRGAGIATLLRSALRNLHSALVFLPLHLGSSSPVLAQDQRPGPTVGDTVWITQDVRVGRGVSVRPRPVPATPALEPLGPPEVIAEDRTVTIRYPLVMWQPGRHSIELPGVILVRADGWSDTLAPATATITVRSVLPGPPSDTMPPAPPQRIVARSDTALLPVLVLLGLALVVLLPVHWWWRKRGATHRESRVVRRESREGIFAPPETIRTWVDAGELRMAAEGWALYLKQRLAVRQDPAVESLVDRLEAARFSTEGETELSQLLSEADRLAEFGPERVPPGGARPLTADRR